MSSISDDTRVANKYMQSVATFPGLRRMHVSLNVSSLLHSLNFYTNLFGVDPVKVREGYAKFDLRDPPLNFSINENPKDTRTQGHLGIQVKSTKAVRAMNERLAQSGFKITTEDSTECCYAVQTKLWVADPDGNRWEIFVTTEPEAEEGCGPDCICHQELERTVL